MASWRTSSAFSRTTSSAAAEGVGARRSATKSAIVTSVSWPTAEITGIFDAAIARATASSLNAQRSSSDPPPRATTITSRSPRRFSVPSAWAISPAAVSPWTRTGHTRTWRPAKRRVTTRRKSRTAAPVGDVTSPTRRGQRGQRPLPPGVEEPLGGEPGLQLLEGELERAQAFRLQHLAHELVLAPDGVDVEPAEREDVEPVGRLEAHPPHPAPEEDGPHLGLLVLQREVDVPRGVDPQVRDLALDPEPAEAALERVLDRARELRDREDPAPGVGERQRQAGHSGDSGQPAGGVERVSHEHGDRHRPDAAGHRRDRAHARAHASRSPHRRRACRPAAG